MTKIKVTFELEYDGDIQHGDDPEGIEWFRNEILLGKEGELLLHSNHIGDTVGKLKGVKIHD